MKIFLKIIKKLHSILLPSASHFGRSDKMYPNKPYAGNLIERAILSGRPLMVARLGATEMSCMVNYLGVKYPKKYRSIFDFVSNRSPAWWWNGSIISQMQSNAGFFSPKIPQIEHFCELMIGDLKNVDILGSWLKEESFFRAELQNAKKVTIEDLEPFFTTNPWTRALKGKKVLVVHPFADTIKR